MKISNCPYIHYETIIGDKCEGNCNLFCEDKYGNIKFMTCESIPISKCEFKKGAIK
jgi:hypothetical protein